MQALPARFSWLWPGELAGSAMPGLGGPLEGHLAALVSAGIGTVLTLTRQPLPADRLQAHGLEWHHLPVPDFGAPSQDLLVDLVLRVEASIGDGRALLVHCRAGLGRTGTALAACLVARGLDWASALGEVRLLRPGSVETRAQEEALRNFQETWSGRSGGSAGD